MRNTVIRSVLFGLAVIVVIFVVYSIWKNHKVDEVPDISEELEQLQQSAEEEEVEEEYIDDGLPRVGDVAIDYTQLGNNYYEYQSTSEFTQDVMEFIVNSSFETNSSSVRLSDEAASEAYQYLSRFLSAESLYVKTHFEYDEVCLSFHTYNDRINPLYFVTFYEEDGTCKVRLDVEREQ